MHRITEPGAESLLGAIQIVFQMFVQRYSKVKHGLSQEREGCLVWLAASGRC